MTTIAVAAKYFGYRVGGAEGSMLEILKDQERQGNRIIVALFENVHTHNAQAFKQTFPSTWEVRHFRLDVDTVRFRFVDYAMNCRKLGECAQALRDADVLHSYGLYAPALLNNFPGRRVYSVRDEYGLGWNKHYYKGARAAAQSLYKAAEWPLASAWRVALKETLRTAELIANSQFIASELRKLAPSRPLQIILPHIDVLALRQDWERHRGSTKQRGIVAVGDNILKGSDIVRRLARRLPDRLFYLFDRRYTQPVKHDNLILMPWGSPGAVFAHADLVLAPARYYEAYCRVAREACELSIPVVGSNRGGIPESIGDSRWLVNDIEDETEWEEKINAAIIHAHSDETCRLEPGPSGRCGATPPVS